jgi:rubrerythrin
MADSIKGTKTEKNLLASFAGESQARNRYSYFAGVARKAGFEQIAEIFLETAENEREHAKIFFKFLEGGDVEITASYPAGVIGDTAASLAAAAAGENLEWTVLYKEAAEIADKEGFPQVAQKYRMVAGVEVEHEKRYRKLLANVQTGKVFQKAESLRWKCRNCGHVHVGNAAPDKCPTCDHAQAFYEVKAENY